MPDPFIHRIHRDPSGDGPLRNLGFAAKDMFDVAGTTCGFGSPDWLRTHDPAADDCAVIATLLGAGATLVGKTHMEELAFSLTGENAHYGAPTNPAAPDRIPGGSSSGSAAAVAAGLVDFALGTDTGGSVRVPASYCGVAGIRTTHGVLEMRGVIPLAPSFDTMGWFSRDTGVLGRVAEVLLLGSFWEPQGLQIADDAFELCSGHEPAWSASLHALSGVLSKPRHVRMAGGSLAEWARAFRALQGAEAWASHGAWIESVRPALGPAIRRRFEYARSVTSEEVSWAEQMRQRARDRVFELLEDGRVLCIPTAPGPAPRRGQSGDASEQFRERTMLLTCIAGLSGVPQVSIPAGAVEGAPIGVSLIGPPGSDRKLIGIARVLQGQQCV